MIEQDKNYIELRKQRNEAERNQADCLYRIKAYRRMLVEANPLDEEAYGELLRKLHEEEDRCMAWAQQASVLHYKVSDIERRAYWGK